jgi:hypothetical protein
LVEGGAAGALAGAIATACACTETGSRKLPAIHVSHALITQREGIVFGTGHIIRSSCASGV